MKEMDRKLYAVATIEKNGKYYSWVCPFRSALNIRAFIEQYKLESCFVYRCKRDAIKVASDWNYTYIENGTYWYMGT